MEWLAENWVYLLAAAIPVIMAIANLVTKHYTEERPGLKRAMLFVVDVLDVLRPLFKPSAAPRKLL